MHVPVDPSRAPPRPDVHTNSEIAIAYLMVLAIPVVFWFVAHPLVGGAAVLGLVGLRVALRRVRAGLEYVREQCCHVLRVGDRVRITLVRRPLDG